METLSGFIKMLKISKAQSFFKKPTGPLFFFLVFTLFFNPNSFAQVDTDFSGGGAVRVGDSTSTCDSSTAGAIRYDADGTNLVGFCNGSTWLDFVTSSVSGVVNNGNSFSAPMIIGTNDANVLQFETGGSNRVTIDTSGNVGIGTDSPSEKLEILRNFAGISDSLKLTNTSASDSRGSGVLFHSGAVDSARLASTRGSNDASGDLHFFTRQSNALVESLSIVGASGFVGIGTTSPAVSLDVNTGSINAAEICDENNANCLDLSAGVAGDNLGSHLATTFLNMDGNNIRHLGIGDAASPGLTFSSDLNTGLWAPAGDTIAASTGGVERFRIDSSGNVGIGTGNPTDLLHMYGSSPNSIGMTIENNSSGANSYAGTLYTGSTANNYLWTGIGNAGSGYPGEAFIEAGGGAAALNIGYSPPLKLLTGTTERMRIDTSGRVGIGTTATTSLLEVYRNEDVDHSDGGIVATNANAGTASAIGMGLVNDEGPIGGITAGSSNYSNALYQSRLSLYSNDSLSTGVNIIAPRADADIRFVTGGLGSGNERVRIDASGNVGIGTTSPAVELDVNTGSINAAEICDENNANCLDLSAGAGGGGYSAGDTILFADGTGANPGLAFNSDPDTGIYTQGSGEIRYTINGGNTATLDGNGFVSWGGLMADNGDATNPDFRFGLDTNTGMFSPSADAIAFSNGGTETFRIDSAGDVWIGSANPNVELDVNGTIKSNYIDVSSTSSPPGFQYTYNNFSHEFDGGGIGPDETIVYGFNSEINNISIDFQDYVITGQFTNRLTAGLAAGQVAVDALSFISTGMSTYETTGVASTVSGSGNINQAYGLKSRILNSNTLDSYGLYIGTINGGDQWGVYQSGADDTNYFAGNIGIGTATPEVELDVHTGSINAAEICDENNANCLDLSAGVGGGSGDISNGGNTNGADITIGTNDAYDLNLEASGSTVATVSSDGEFIVGSPNAMFSGTKKLRVESNPWDASGDFAHINNEMYKNGNAHFGKIIGIRNQIRGDSGNSQDEQIATYNMITTWANSLNSGMGTYNELESKAGSTTDMTGSLSNLTVDGGTVQNYYGFRAMASNSATLTNAYGLYIDDLPGTTTYGIYQDGSSDDNYFSGNVGVGTNAPSAKLEVVGEVRPVDSSGNNRLWGQGRPGVARYGTSGVEAGLCTNGGVSFGLSYSAVNWEGSASACPQGTWVCTAAEKGTATCNTARPDHVSNDGTDCTGSFVNYPSNNHQGWVADIGGYVNSGYTISENGTTDNGLFPCNAQPVWCCSE